MTSVPQSIIQAKGSEQSRKAILTKIHRIIDAYEDGRGASSCMSDIKQIIGRAA